MCTYINIILVHLSLMKYLFVDSRECHEIVRDYRSAALPILLLSFIYLLVFTARDI